MSLAGALPRALTTSDLSKASKKEKKPIYAPSLRRKRSKPRMSMPSVANLFAASNASKDSLKASAMKWKPSAKQVEPARSVEIIRTVSQAGIARPLPRSKSVDSHPSSRRGSKRVSCAELDGNPLPMSSEVEEDAKMDEIQEEAESNNNVFELASNEIPQRPATVDGTLRPTDYLALKDSRPDSRPRIHVAIPETRALSFTGSFWQKMADNHDSAKEVVPSSGGPSISPASTTVAHSAGPIATPFFSVVSPLNGKVEMPSPQRPVSVSFDTTMLESTSDPITKTSSSSSEKSDEHDEDDRSCYSKESSTSSIELEQETLTAVPKPLQGGRTGSRAYSIGSPVSFGVFDEYQSTYILQKQKSKLSIAEDIKNKPLPPEPCPEVAPLMVAGKGGVPLGRKEQEQKHVRMASESRSRSKPKPAHISLQSKYSPTALDKLDEAFRQTSPTRLPRKQSPTLDQAAQELVAKLSSLKKREQGASGAVSWDESLALNAPIQVSRGNMSMIPSRKAPTPPAADAPAIPPKSLERELLFKIKNSPESSVVASREASPSKTEKRLSLSALRKWTSRSSRNNSITSLAESAKHSRTSSEGEQSVFSTASGHRSSTGSAMSLPADSMKIPVSMTADGGKMTVSKTVDAGKIPISKVSDSMKFSNSSQPKVSELSGVPASPTIPDRVAKSTAPPIEPPVSADAGEKIILRIFESLNNLSDLFATAFVSKGFYNTFKRHELRLIKETVFKVSPAAWELREMSPPWAKGDDAENDAPVPEYTTTSYLRHYSRDMYTMIALKPLILVHCESFLRPETVAGLAGIDELRSAQIDEAFCRVWTFCRMFGCNKDREDDISAQMDWLRGGVFTHKRSNRLADKFGVDTVAFAKGRTKRASTRLAERFGVDTALFDPPDSFAAGNGEGLTSDELYAMTEVWTCLGVLVQGFHGQCDAARSVGIFDDADSKGDTTADEVLLEEWTSYLLTLGPAVILNLATVSPSGPTPATFARAKEAGWTKWTPPTHGATRSSFLKEAVSRVYSAKVTAEAVLTNAPSNLDTIQEQTSDSRLDSHLKRVVTTRKRQAAFAAELQKLRGRRPSAAGPKTWSEERPISIFPDIVEQLEHRNGAYAYAGVAGSVASQPPKGPQVRDPVDLAMEKLVGEMGFDEKEATRALAQTDTGDSLDVPAAVKLLQREARRRERQVAAAEKHKPSMSSSSIFGDSDVVSATRNMGQVAVPKRESSTYHAMSRLGRSGSKKVPSKEKSAFASMSEKGRSGTNISMPEKERSAYEASKSIWRHNLRR